MREGVERLFFRAYFYEQMAAALPDWSTARQVCIQRANLYNMLLADAQAR